MSDAQECRLYGALCLLASVGAPDTAARFLLIIFGAVCLLTAHKAGQAKPAEQAKPPELRVYLDGEWRLLDDLTPEQQDRLAAIRRGARRP